ncbi:MAG: hypothetical protein NTW64_00335 [Candidatus Omnitrophica bacterium]|nr:hypothetical protein [Candidatus Omnitrophota bacterium]
MKFNLDKSVTLLELLIAMSLLGLLVIGISSIETFSRYQLTSAGIRSRLQNEVSFLLEHMAKNVNMAIGDYSNLPVDTSSIDGDTAIRVYVDLTSGGLPPGDGKRGAGGDCWIAYRFRPATSYQIWYYANYSGPSSANETIAHDITDFTASYSNSNNYIEVIATACANPPCGSINHPNVTMTSRIEMPSVSLH